MTTIRRQYPRVRQYIKSGKNYFSVDLRRKHYQGQKFKNFNNREAAMNYATAIGEKVAKSGLDSLIGVDPRIKAWQEQFAIYGKTPEDGINTALAVYESERKVKESPFMGELLSVWSDDKTSNKLKPLRPETQRMIRSMANRFQSYFGNLRIKEITQDRVETYLTDMPVSNQTKANIKNYLGQFFNWCKKKHYHNENPAEDIEITVESKVPQFFTVDQCKEILCKCLTEDKRMLPYFVLALFGGIRPDEIARMTWNNIKGTQIELHASITKTKRSRLFTMSDNLVQWINYCKDVKTLVPDGITKYNRVKLCKNLSFKWVPDGLRHTFATFHYAKHKSFELLTHDMGNSPRVIERFYKGTIEASEVEKFWSITPESIVKS